MKVTKILVIAAVSFLMSCSKQDSEKVEINFEPESPRVRFVAGKAGTNDTVISAPWFKFKANIHNGSDKNLIINSLKLTARGLSLKNGVVIGTADFTAESAIDGTEDTSVAGQDLTVLASVTSGVTQPAYFEFYVQSLPVEVTSGVFDVEVLAEGWFGEEDNPRGLFRQKYFFTTQ